MNRVCPLALLPSCVFPTALDAPLIRTMRAFVRHSANPLRDIGNMTLLDVSQLSLLTAQRGREIRDER